MMRMDLAKDGKVTYKIKNMDSIFNAIEAIYRDTVRSREELEKIAIFARDRVVAETRKGNDLEVEGKQPPLSPGYIEYRKKLAGVDRKKKKNAASGAPGGYGDYQKVDPTFFNANKSNLTLTGQLLESIDYKIESDQATIIITPTGSRDDGKTNLEVAEELANRKTKLAPSGRKFLGLDIRAYKRIRSLIVEAIRRNAIKKGF